LAAVRLYSKTGNSSLPYQICPAGGDFQGDQFNNRARGSNSGLPLLNLMFLLLGAASISKAGDICNNVPYFGVIGGNVLGTPPI